MSSDEEERKKQLDAVQAASKASKAGPKYIISDAWLTTWKGFIGGGARPGPIDNSNLLREDGKPKPDLEKAKHYRGLNQTEWGVFFDAYGGGPIIVRNEINIYGEPFETEKPKDDNADDAEDEEPIPVADVDVDEDKLKDQPLFYADKKLKASKETLIDFEKGMLSVTKKGAKILQDLKAKQHCNLVFIFGNARSGSITLSSLDSQPIDTAQTAGKSFMMNCLVGQRGLFKVINSSQPCTRGVDISSYVAPHSSLLSHVASYATPNEERERSETAMTRMKSFIGNNKNAPDGLVGFVDVEGQGAEDGTYDTLLALPLLVTSKVVLFNHKGAPTVSHMLSQLGVLARAAEYIELGDSKKKRKGGAKQFGHLHVMFRDFSFEGSEDDVYEQLMGMEELGKKSLKPSNNDPYKATQERNDIRELLLGNFESIHVWLFKQPSTPDNLREHAELPPELIDASFIKTVKRLLATMTEQLKTPKNFNGSPLNGPKLTTLVRQVCTQLNEGGSISVPSVFKAMESETLQRVADLCLADFEWVVHKIRKKMPLGLEDVTKEVNEAHSEMLTKFDEELIDCMLHDEKKKARDGIIKSATESGDQVVKDNKVALIAKVEEVANTGMQHVKEGLDEFCKEKLPCESADLTAEFEKLKAEAVKITEEALESIKGAFNMPEFERASMTCASTLLEFFSLKTAQNDNIHKNDAIQKMQEEQIKQQKRLIAQNEELEKFVSQEKATTKKMKEELNKLQKDKQSEEKRAKEVQQQVAKQEKELEKMRKRRMACNIL